MNTDYANPYHVDYLFRHLYNKDITDWHGLGLILWDVYEILTRQLDLNTDEFLLVQHLAAGYELEELAPDLKECFYPLIQKFVQYHL